LREDIPLTSPDPALVDAWVSAARQDNPGVRAAGLQAEAAERDISVQRGRGLPSISLNGSSSRSWQDEAFGGKQSLDTVGISFNWPLFQSGAISSALRQSRALYRQAEALYDTAQRDTERQTRAAYRGVVTGISRLTAARRAVESGRQAVEARPLQLDLPARLLDGQGDPCDNRDGQCEPSGLSDDVADPHTNPPKRPTSLPYSTALV